MFGVLIAAARGRMALRAEIANFYGSSASTPLAAHQAQVYTAFEQRTRTFADSQTVMQQETPAGFGQMASGIAHDITMRFRRLRCTPSRCSRPSLS